MIIIKTANGDSFINEKETQIDQYRKKETENIILEDRIARLQEKLRDFGCEL